LSGSLLKKNEQGFPEFRVPALILWQGPRNMAASERGTMSEDLLLRREAERSEKMRRLFFLAVILVSITVGAPSQCAQKSSDAQAYVENKVAR
jgi:hypothetical protein